MGKYRPSELVIEWQDLTQNINNRQALILEVLDLIESKLNKFALIVMYIKNNQILFFFHFKDETMCFFLFHTRKSIFYRPISFQRIWSSLKSPIFCSYTATKKQVNKLKSSQVIHTSIAYSCFIGKKLAYKSKQWIMYLLVCWEDNIRRTKGYSI